MSSENVYLPGKIRDRIQDLMKSRKVTQAELATRIGVSESSLSRCRVNFPQDSPVFIGQS